MRESHTNLRKIHIDHDAAALSLPERADIGDTTRERIVSAGLFPPLTRRHGIVLCGVSEAEAGFSFVRRRPAMWQTMACLGGSGMVWDGAKGVWHPLSRGFAYISPPGIPHAYHIVPGDEPWRLAWVMLAPQSINAKPAPPSVCELDGEPLASSIRGLHTEALNQDGGDPVVTESWAALVRAYSARLCAASVARHEDRSGIDARLVQLFAAVVADPAHPWTLAALASHVGVSREHLRRMCLIEGMGSPVHRVTEIRIRHAAALLASGFYTVERAAARVGYSNPFAFSTAFKRIMGSSPSSLRP